MSEKSRPIAIVGGGIAGLTAAFVLTKAGRQVLLFEKSDQIGGRMRTDSIEGFQLDRGFQVFLTAYPEAQKVLDYQALNLGTFDPGAMILRPNQRQAGVWDIMRLPGKLFDLVFNDLAAPSDLYRIWSLRSMLRKMTIPQILTQPEKTTLAFLKDFGFSNRIIDQFFKPFYTGIFLEKDLTTSSRMFCFVFKMFGEGDAALPAGGIQQIPIQIAAQLPENTIYTDTEVYAYGSHFVDTNRGRFDVSAVIVATDIDNHCSNWHETGVFYFSADESPFKDKAIGLVSEEAGLVNSISVLSDVAIGYAPKGKSLISVALKSWPKDQTEAQMLAHVQEQLVKTVPSSETWRFLKSYHISKALPENNHLKSLPDPSILPDSEGVFHCGDHLVFGSVNAAMASGRLAAEAVLAN
jgi:protoporphyrinogen oxidase